MLIGMVRICVYIGRLIERCQAGLPQRDLEESIRDAVAWFIEHDYLEKKVAR